MNDYPAIIGRFSTTPEATLGTMFGAQVTKVRSKVLAMNLEGRLVVKVPRDRVFEPMEAQVGAPFGPGHDRIMKKRISAPRDSAIGCDELAGEAH